MKSIIKLILSFIVFAQVNDISADWENMSINTSAVEMRGKRLMETTHRATATQVAVGNAQNVWALNTGNVYRWDHEKNNWEQIPGKLTYISVSGENVWGVNDKGEIYHWNGAAWNLIPGSLAQISVGCDGTVWGVNKNGAIYRMTSASGTWKLMPGKVTQIAVGSARNIWALNAGDVFRWDHEENNWKHIPGKLTYISASGEEVWGTNDKEEIYHWNGASWSLMPGNLPQISVGCDGAVWGISNTQDLYRLRK